MFFLVFDPRRTIFFSIFFPKIISVSISAPFHHQSKKTVTFLLSGEINIDILFFSKKMPTKSLNIVCYSMKDLTVGLETLFNSHTFFLSPSRLGGSFHLLLVNNNIFYSNMQGFKRFWFEFVIYWR